MEQRRQMGLAGTIAVVMGESIALGIFLKEPVRSWWYPSAPILFLLGCGVIDLLILLHDPIPALLGLLAVLCGDPVRHFFFSSPRPTVATPISEQNFS